MIVISGALVLVALVLLVIGIVGPELGFVYASIGVSLVSLVFLVIGILQRRGEPLPSSSAAAPAATVEEPAESLTAVLPRAPRPAEPEPVAASAEQEPETGGTVLVVAGRPRYHVAGCRYLSAKQAEAVDVLDAREEGFSPCGVCKPDDALRALEAGAAPVAPVAEPLVLEEVEASTPTRVARSGGSRKVPAATRAVPAETARPVRRAAAAKAVAPAAPAKTGAAAMPEATPADGSAELPAAAVVEAPVVEAPAAAAKAPARTAAKTAAKAAAKPTAKTAGKAPAAVKAAPVPVKAAPAPVKAAKAPAKAAALAADSPAATTARKTGSVVVIPDRGRFHRPECRYVRGVDGAEVLTRAAASRQGYEACGVCKP